MRHKVANRNIENLPSLGASYYLNTSVDLSLKYSLYFLFSD